MVRDGTADPEKLEQRVQLIRDHMTDVVRELDHRRHQLTDVKGQLQQHAPVAIGVGVGVLALLGGGIGWAVYRAKQREREQRPLRRFVRPWRQEPEKQFESIPHRLLSAAAGALVGVLARSLAQRFMKPAIEAGTQPLPALPDY